MNNSVVAKSDILEPTNGKQYRVESHLLEGQVLNKVNCKKSLLIGMFNFQRKKIIWKILIAQ